jgi:hypothetical protein
LTRPEIEACAYADTGRAVTATITQIRRKAHNMSVLLPAATRFNDDPRGLWRDPKGRPDMSDDAYLLRSTRFE